MENKNFKKNDNLLFIGILKNSFMELLPYVILFSIFVITRQVFDLFNNVNYYAEIIESVIKSLQLILPILLLFTISTNYAKVKNEHISLSAISSMLIYIFFLLNNNKFNLVLDTSITIYTLVIPYISINILSKK